MPLAIIKPFLVSAKSYNKFNHFQRTGNKGKSQDICQEPTVTSGHTKLFFSEIFGGILKAQQ